MLGSFSIGQLQALTVWEERGYSHGDCSDYCYVCLSSRALPPWLPNFHPKAFFSHKAEIKNSNVYIRKIWLGRAHKGESRAAGKLEKIGPFP